MNAITALITIRDNLRSNVVDPFFYAGATSRSGSSFIFMDEPHSITKYPVIEIEKINNPSEIIEIGPEHMEWEMVFSNIWFTTKNGFKCTISGTEYSNSMLVQYYLDYMKNVLKGQLTVLHNLGVGGIKSINTTKVLYDSNTQTYSGALTIRCWFFTTRL